MDMRELRYFIAVFEVRNLTVAAKRCFVSQPSISVAIQDLEQELGTALFIRHKKGVTPTSSAEDLYPLARRLVGEAEAVRKLFKRPASRRYLTLGLMRTLDIQRTVALLKPLTSAPDLYLRLVGSDEACDARLISKVMLKSKENFVPLWTERYAVALPPAHELALKPRLRAADLAGARLIDRCHCEYGEFFARTGSSLETAAIAQSEEWALALVAAGVGIAILPEGVARSNPGVVVREIADIEVTREVGLGYGEMQSPSAELQQFIEGLRTQRPSKRAGGRQAKLGARRLSVPRHCLSKAANR
jgi:DNA-binding transcriptional LysR family regulator